MNEIVIHKESAVAIGCDKNRKVVCNLEQQRSDSDYSNLRPRSIQERERLKRARGKGTQPNPTQLNSTEQSRLTIVVFSNYRASRWLIFFVCLALEMVHWVFGRARSIHRPQIMAAIIRRQNQVELTWNLVSEAILIECDNQPYPLASIIFRVSSDSAFNSIPSIELQAWTQSYIPKREMIKVPFSFFFAHFWITIYCTRSLSHIESLVIGHQQFKVPTTASLDVSDQASSCRNEEALDLWFCYPMSSTI